MTYNVSSYKIKIYVIKKYICVVISGQVQKGDEFSNNVRRIGWRSKIKLRDKNVV